MSAIAGTRITLANENGEYSVFVPRIEATLTEIMDVMRSVLMAAGYHQVSIHESLSEKE